MYTRNNDILHVYLILLLQMLLSREVPSMVRGLVLFILMMFSALEMSQVF